MTSSKSAQCGFHNLAFLPRRRCERSFFWSINNTLLRAWPERITWEVGGMCPTFHTQQPTRMLACRNFAKARSKDTAAKAQRNHFGKQKILSRGLCKPAVSSRDSQDPSSNPIARISLAHARQDPSIRRSQPQSDTRPSSFMVFSPPRSSVRTFRTLSAANHKRPNFLDYAARKTPPPGKRPSAILREVDLTERTLRAAYMLHLYH